MPGLGHLSAHHEVRVPAEDAEGRKKLAGYLLRAPMSLDKMTYRGLHNYGTSLDPSPPTPLPEGEGSVERNRTVARFRNFQLDSIQTRRDCLQLDHLQPHGKRLRNSGWQSFHKREVGRGTVGEDATFAARRAERRETRSRSRFDGSWRRAK